MGSLIQTSMAIVWGLLLGQLAIGFAAPLDAIVPAAAAPIPAQVAAPIETALESPPIQPAVPIQSPPVVAPATPADLQGTGFVTEHKNPDGSVLTITRFNGPLPASAFPNVFAPSIFPFGGYFPYGPYGGYGYGGPAPPAQPAVATG